MSNDKLGRSLFRRSLLLTVLLWLGMGSFASPLMADWTFVRGDANGDALVDVSDPVYALNYLFDFGPVLCLDAVDANDDGLADVSDAVYLLEFLFNFGAPPPPPLDTCGIDPTDDAIGCDGPLPGCPGSLGPPSTPVLDAFNPFTADATITLSGDALGANRVIVTTPVGVVEYPVVDDRFDATAIPLLQNAVNNLYFVSVNASDEESSAIQVNVVQDSQAPQLSIQYPLPDSEFATPTIEVLGTVSDSLSGQLGISVTVNGIAASVDEGLGATGTFLAVDVPLMPSGPTILEITASDTLGNSATTTRTVFQVIPAPGIDTIQPFSGNAQSGPVLSLLPDPIEVVLTRGDGTPFENKLVNFQITRNDGWLNTTGDLTGTTSLAVFTDSQGIASVRWGLGMTAGQATNRVQVTSAGVSGSVIFCASGEGLGASQINMSIGNSQYVETGAPAPIALRAWVSDGINPVAGEPVQWTVLDGGGQIQGQSSIVLDTMGTGHTAVTYTMGTSPGTNLIEASLVSDPSQRVRFMLVGIERDLAQPTRFSGVVINNAEQGIEGATCTLDFGVEEFVTTSGLNGEFSFPDLTETGPAHLIVNGSTAFSVGGATGRPIDTGSFPTVSYSVVIVPNAANTLPRPAELPPLDPANEVDFDGSDDVVLTIGGIEGFELHIPATTEVTLHDGTVITAGSGESVTLSLNRVNHDDIPMPIPDGAAPAFAWTFQPADAHFDPPVSVVYPNLSALPPLSIAYFISFNHTNNRFEIVCSGTVTEDGSSIVSDPGTGISVSGWGCNCPPYSVSGDCCGATPDQCYECVDGEIVAVADGASCDDGDECTEDDVCTGGTCEGELPADTCMPPTATYDQSAWTSMMGGSNFAALDRMEYDGGVCFDQAGKVWRYRAEVLNTFGRIVLTMAGSTTPNPAAGGNVGDCPPAAGQFCWCDIVADLADYKGPMGGRGMFHSIEASTVHEEYHRDVDFPNIFQPLWTQAVADMYALTADCSLSEADAETALKAQADVIFCAMVAQYTMDVTTFVAAHNSPPYDDGAYCVGQAVLDGISADVTAYATAEGFAACAPFTGPPPLFGPPTGPRPVSLELTSTLTVLAVGQGAQLTAIVTFDDDSTADVTLSPDVTYGSYGRQAMVDSSGQITALSPGLTMIQVLYCDVTDCLPLPGVVEIRVIDPLDQDGDFLPDAYEDAVGLDPADPSDAQADFDGDDLTCLQEYLEGTNPFVFDTDGDGIGDGDEVATGDDPRKGLDIPANAQVTVNGQTVPVDENGNFRIFNVLAPDQFGPGGPGTAPDFTSDEWFRVTGTGQVDGNQVFISSDKFRIEQGDNVNVNNLVVSRNPIPIPETIQLVVPGGGMEFDVGSFIQLQTLGTLPNGDFIDVTGGSFTTYRSSNPNRMKVNDNGLVEIVDAGTVFLSASNDGATSALRLIGVTPDPTATVIGYTELSVGNPLEGVEITIDGAPGLSTMSGPDGFFQLNDVPADGSIMALQATITIAGQLLGATVVLSDIEADQIVDAGVVNLTGGPAYAAQSVSGLAEVNLGVVLDTDITLRGWSFGLCHDPALVEPTEALTTPFLDSLGGGAGPGFNQIAVVPGLGVTQAVVIDFLGVTTLPPGVGYYLLSIDYDLLGPVGSITDVCFCSTIPGGAAGPVSTVVTDLGGLSQATDGYCGEITITDQP